jgi:hypothetical protein
MRFLARSMRVMLTEVDIRNVLEKRCLTINNTEPDPNRLKYSALQMVVQRC